MAIGEKLRNRDKVK